MKRLINAIILSVAIMSATMAVSCSSDDEPAQGNELKEIVLTRGQQDAVDSQARFAFDYFRRTAEYLDQTENISLSPLSLSIDLAILANGAGEDTYRELTKATHLPDISVGELNELYSHLIHDLLSMDNKVSLCLSNALWHSQEVSIKPGFASDVQAYYGGCPISTLDFNNTELTRNTINAWAAEKTNGMIDEYFKRGSTFKSRKFILGNAVCFNGEWKNGFDKALTKKRNFTNIDKSQSYVETMGCNAHFDLAKVRNFADVIALPYGNGAFSMYIIVPAVDRHSGELLVSFDQMESQIDYDWWVNTKKAMYPQDVNLLLPKFKVKSDLNSIGTAFFPELAPVMFSPDLTKMTDAKDVVLMIDQSTSIETSETGTIASSVTFVSGMDYASPSYDFNVNRPFIYLIEEQSTGAILFMGHVVKL